MHHATARSPLSSSIVQPDVQAGSADAWGSIVTSALSPPAMTLTVRGSASVLEMVKAWAGSA